MAHRAPPVGAGAGITASDILRSLQERVFLILLVWVLGSAFTVGITLVAQRYFPLWTSHALIRVESPSPGNPFDPWGMRVDRDTMERNLADQANIIRDLALLREVLASPEVRVETDWFKQFGDDVDKALEELDEKLAVGPMRGTSLLRVAMPTRNPKDSPKIVNKIVAVYMETVKTISRSKFLDEAEAFAREVQRKEQQLQGIHEELARLEREAEIPGMRTGAPTVTARLGDLQREIVGKEADLELLRARYNAYKDARADDIRSSPELMSRMENDPKVFALARHLRDLVERKEVLLVRLGSQHLEVRETDRQIESCQEELDALRKETLREGRELLTESYRTAFFAALRAVAELREALQEATQMQLDLDAKLQRHEILQSQLQNVERERDRLAEAHAQLQLVARTDEPVRIYRFRKALVPLEPSRPQPRLWITIGVSLSLLFGVGIALGLNLLDTSLRTPRDIIRHVGLPLLGTVPVLDDEEATVEEIETASRVAPQSLVAESFRQVRGNLLFSAPIEQQRSILITSASPSEGKTCVAINLAVMLAQGGRRILLVDANFRRPSLHRAFAVSNQRGLSNLLVGQGQLNDFVAHTDLPHLDILVAGPCPPNPAELLASGKIRDVLAEGVERYDQVILDGPPVLVVSDTMVLAAMVDGVLFVCRARTGRGMVQRAKTQLSQVNSRLIGAVLNAAETTRGGYFRKYYRAFYDYQEPEDQDEREQTEDAGLGALPGTAPSELDNGPRDGSDSDRSEADGWMPSEPGGQNGSSASDLGDDTDTEIRLDEGETPEEDGDESPPFGP